ncbi:hypothetical protein CGCF415_v010125 [Colletotrichum fructicola]|nr:hypothetical protein CGCF415_v010125 [Colletotrichum fructicola]
MAHSPSFAESCKKYDLYPFNLLSASEYGTTVLNEHASKVHESRKLLFLHDENKFKIPVRDVSGSGTVSKINIMNEGALRDFLGDAPLQTHPASQNQPTALVAKPDPACRFIFFLSESAIAPLWLNSKMLFFLLTFYQVMPQLLDFLLVYASPHGEDRELRFSGFRTYKMLSNPIPGSVIPQLGRSGRKYQLCFNLKTVALKKTFQATTWKVRQAAVHHQFDLGQGTQVWMIADPHAAIKSRIDELYNTHRTYETSFTSVEQGFKSSLDIHLALARWATSEWRWHVRYLEEKAEQPALTIALKEKRHIETLDLGLLSEMQRWEEKANENIMVMESNVKIMTLLQRFYKELVNDEDFPRNQRRPGRQAVKNFAFQLDEIICDTRMQIDRGKILVKILADRKAVLIQHLQTQTALAAEKLAASMYEQANRSAIETIAVRIVTIVTLIYLPATFSSTLFSTDIIKYQEGESFSSLALYRFLQVTIPLMVLTFLGAGAWFWVEWTKRDRESQELKDQYPDSFQRPMKEKP